MEWSEKDYKKIQQYLDGLIHEDDLHSFETEMEQNAELIDEVNFHQEMDTYLSDTPKNLLRQNLQKLGDQYQETPTKTFNYYWILLPIILLGLSIWGYHALNNTPQEIKVEPYNSTIETDEQDILPDLDKTDTVFIELNTNNDQPPSEDDTSIDVKKNLPIDKRDDKVIPKKKVMPTSPSGRPIAEEPIKEIQILEPPIPSVDPEQFASTDPAPNLDDLLADASIPPFDSALIEWNPIYPDAIGMLSPSNDYPRNIYESYAEFENQIAQNFKQKGLKIIVERQPLDSIFLSDFPDNNIDLNDNNRLILTIQSTKDLMKENPEIRVYDNIGRITVLGFLGIIKPYKANEISPINTYRIDTEIDLSPTPGLYYYGLQGEETYFMGKYAVVSSNPDIIYELYADSFEPNQQLEFLIDNHLRDSGLSIKVANAPKTLFLQSNQDSVLFTLKAKFNAAADLSDKKITVNIFNNNPSLYEDFYPAYSEIVPLLEEEKNQFVMSTETYFYGIGLYYYLIEDPETEKIYHVGKFEVRYK